MFGVRSGCVLLLGLGAFLGCGESEGVPTVVVTGTVTQKGAPVAGAAVSFIPSGTDGQNAVGVTDASGKYSLDHAEEGRWRNSRAVQGDDRKYDGPKETAGGGAAHHSGGQLACQLHRRGT